MEKEKTAKEGAGKEKEKVRTLKLEWDGEMIDTLLDKLNEDKETYWLTVTNYTCKIETEDLTYYFLKHLQRPVVFSVANKLKHHVSTSLDTDVPYINRDDMRYYNAKVQTRPIFKHIAYNIDINTAYPTCLFNDKLIDKKLFDQLMGLEKPERLAAIGMLAARKRMFKIVEGEVAEYIDNESEYAKYFFHCVKTISQIIWNCEVISGTSYCFSWVDGLYVLDKSTAERCRRLIIDAGYKATVSEIQDFQYIPHDTKIEIRFYSLKDKENKLFNIPIENNSLAQILKFLHK